MILEVDVCEERIAPTRIGVMPMPDSTSQGVVTYRSAPNTVLAVSAFIVPMVEQAYEEPTEDEIAECQRLTEQLLGQIPPERLAAIAVDATPYVRPRGV